MATSSRSTPVTTPPLGCGASETPHHQEPLSMLRLPSTSEFISISKQCDSPSNRTAGTTATNSLSFGATGSLDTRDECDSPHAVPVDPDDPLSLASPLTRARRAGRSDSLHVAPVVESTRAQKSQLDGRKRINRYTVLDLLGRGAYSKVKLCQHDDGTYYALKILSRSVLKSRGIGASSALLKFRREVAILKRLRHPHIIALQEVIDDPGSEKLYLILELAEGRELVTLDENNAVVPDEDGVNKIPEAATQRLALGLIDAIAFAHENGVAHRDIKPQNILLSDNDVPKLSDFGVSAIIDDSPLVTCAEGTIAFLPPELLEVMTGALSNDSCGSVPSWQGSFAVAPRQWSGNTTPVHAPCANPLVTTPIAQATAHEFPASAQLPPVVDLFKADVWSLAVTIFVVVTGHHPWPEAHSAGSLLQAIRSRPPLVILTELRRSKALSAELADFLVSGMMVDPEERMSIFAAKVHPWSTRSKLLRDPLASPAPEPAMPLALDEEDVANAVTYAKVATAKVTEVAPAHFYIRRGRHLSNLQFLDVAGTQQRPTESRAYDDSCIVSLRPEQVERTMLQQSLAMSIATINSFCGSPSATQPPSPHFAGSQRRRSGSTEGGSAHIQAARSQLSPTGIESVLSGASTSVNSPHLSRSCIADLASPLGDSGSPTNSCHSSLRRRAKGHHRSWSQPHFTSVPPCLVVEAPCDFLRSAPLSEARSAGYLTDPVPMDIILPPAAARQLQLDAPETGDLGLTVSSQCNESATEELDRWHTYFTVRKDSGPPTSSAQ